MSTRGATTAFRELLDTLPRPRRQLPRGDRAVTDERSVADGYRMLDHAGRRPRHLPVRRREPAEFVEHQHPVPPRPPLGRRQHRRLLRLCPVNPARRYRISGHRGDSVYFSVTVYNEPSPGAWSDKDHRRSSRQRPDIGVDADGTFRSTSGRSSSPTPPSLVTRDYQVDPFTGRRSCGRSRRTTTRADPARRRRDRRRAAARRAWLGRCSRSFRSPWLRERRRAHARAQIAAASPTTFGEPTRCPTSTSAGRRATRGTRSAASPRSRRGARRHPPTSGVPVLEPHRVEPVHGVPTPRRRRSSVNGTEAVPNADGTVTIVIARAGSTTPTPCRRPPRRGATWPSAGSSPTPSRPDRRRPGEDDRGTDRVS